MSTNTNHSTKPVEDGIPAILDRRLNAVGPTQTKAAALTSTAPVKATEQPKVEATKPATKAKQAKATKPAKAKKAKAAPKVEATAEATEEEDDDEPAVKRSIVPARYKAKYAETQDTCGTPLTLAIKAATTGKNADGRPCLLVSELMAIAKANGIDTAKYEGLNNGQKRMNVYNRLIGLQNDGKDVRVGKQVFKAADHTPTTAKPKAKPAKAAPKSGKAKPQAEQRAAA